MPYQILWEPPHGVVRRYQGAITGRQQLESLQLVMGDERFDTLRYSLTDYLDVDHYELADGDFDTLAALHYGSYQSNPRIGYIAVARHADVRVALERFIGMGVSPYPLHVVPTMEQARRIVGRLAKRP